MKLIDSRELVVVRYDALEDDTLLEVVVETRVGCELCGKDWHCLSSGRDVVPAVRLLQSIAEHSC